jgi:hypothetical protein
MLLRRRGLYPKKSLNDRHTQQKSLRVSRPVRLLAQKVVTNSSFALNLALACYKSCVLLTCIGGSHLRLVLSRCERKLPWRKLIAKRCGVLCRSLLFFVGLYAVLGRFTIIL